MNRPSWDEYFVQIAQLVSTRATCLRKHVGAVLTRDNRILTTGYNGAPPGMPHCTDVVEAASYVVPEDGHADLMSVGPTLLGCEMFEGHCVRTIHAEANAIITAARHGVSTEGSTLYTTASLCFPCTNLAIGAGVMRVVYLEQYREEAPLAKLTEAGVAVVLHRG